jgi:hypothetical protein
MKVKICGILEALLLKVDCCRVGALPCEACVAFKLLLSSREWCHMDGSKLKLGRVDVTDTYSTDSLENTKYFGKKVY